MRDRVRTRLRRGAFWWMFLAIVLGATISDAGAQGFTLERVVLVSRHGVRAPTDSPALVELSRSLSWPKWPVRDGHLTLRGRMLASRMGEYYGAEFAARGLFPAGSLTEKQVYVWADVDQRTKETGAGLLEGIFACQDDCPSPGNDYGSNDALFHPVRGGVCNLDPALARQAILNQAGNSLDKALAPYRGIVRQLQDVLDCCQPKLCGGTDGGCTLETLPSKVEGASLAGPIAVGSIASEVFLLEYAQAMAKVAWDRAPMPEAINSFLKLHTLQYELVQRAPYIARRQGSALLLQVLETLRQTAEGQSRPLRPVPRDARLVIFVGHDTNLANIGGMLGVNWTFKSGLEDRTPPAGAMAFELLRETATGNRFVRMMYYSQTLEQMRNATRLSPPAPRDAAGSNVPDETRIDPGCPNARDGMCPWSDFAGWLKGALEPDCASLQPPR